MGLPDVLVDLFKKLPSCSGEPSTLERAGRHQYLQIGAVYDHDADAVEVRLHSKVLGVVGPLTEQHHREQNGANRPTTSNPVRQPRVATTARSTASGYSA